MNLFKSFLLVTLCGTLFLNACKPEAPIAGEEEIDTVRILIDGQTIEWTVDDIVNPTITLEVGKTYPAEIQFWNLQDNENITTEVKAEADEHLVCYEILDAALVLTNSDTDGMFPIGLETEWEAGTASSGTLSIELRHQPGVKNGNCTPGDTDVLADFEIVIQ